MVEIALISRDALRQTLQFQSLPIVQQQNASSQKAFQKPISPVILKADFWGDIKDAIINKLIGGAAILVGLYSGYCAIPAKYRTGFKSFGTISLLGIGYYYLNKSAEKPKETSWFSSLTDFLGGAKAAIVPNPKQEMDAAHAKLCELLQKQRSAPPQDFDSFKPEIDAAIEEYEKYLNECLQKRLITSWPELYDCIGGK